MFRSGGFILIRVLLTVLIIGGLVAGGVWLYNAGQAQGYAVGLAAGSKAPESQAPAVPAPGYFPGYFYGPGYGPWFGWGHFFPPFGLFFFCLIPLFFIFLISGAFHRRGWRHGWHGEPGGGPWHHHPWYGPEQPAEQKQPPEEKQPPAAEPKNP